MWKDGYVEVCPANRLLQDIEDGDAEISEYILNNYDNNLPHCEAYFCNIQDVILDYGFWNPEIREKAKEKALKLTDSIIWHQLVCEMDIAKNRVLKRTSENPQELYIDENCFYDRLKRYHPITESEQLNVQYHYTGDYSKYKKCQ